MGGWSQPPLASSTSRTRGCEYSEGCEGVWTTMPVSPVESRTMVPVVKMPSAPMRRRITVRSEASVASCSSLAMASSAEGGFWPGAGVSASLKARAVWMMRACRLGARRPR